MASPKEFVNSTVNAGGVVVFSKTYCPFCVKAKRALTSAGIPFTTVELDTRPDGRALQQALLAKTGQRTVPNIFRDGQHVGGCDDTLAALRSGRFSAPTKNKATDATDAPARSRPRRRAPRRAPVAAPPARSSALAAAGAAVATGSSGNQAPETPTQIVDRVVASAPVVVFSKTYCPYCVRAKRALTAAGIRFAVVELDARPDGRALQQALLVKTGQRTVPSIFLQGKHIGGCDDTLRELRSGTFASVAAGAGHGHGAATSGSTTQVVGA